MKFLNRATAVLAAIFSFFVFMYAASFFVQSSKNRHFSTKLIMPQDKNDIAEIQFFIPLKAEPVEMGSMVLKKINERFFLSIDEKHYALRDAIIERFFSLLSHSRSLIPISKNVQSYTDYGIDDAHAARIVLIKKDRTIAAELFFGTTDALAVSRYMRTGRSLTVFSIDNAIAPFLTIDHGFWLDLQLYKAFFSQTTIQNIEVGRHYIIRNAENTKDFTALEHFLQTFTCIAVFTAPILQSPDTEHIRLLLGSGDTLHLFYTPLQNGDYVFFDSRNPNAYVISGYTAEQLIKKIQTLVNPAHPF